MDYDEFLSQKNITFENQGFDIEPTNKYLFDFQKDITLWALRKGKAAVFAGCGLGKTLISLEWARIVSEQTSGKVLIIAPLAVSHQTVREGEKFGIKVKYCRDQKEIEESDNIIITTYGMIKYFDVQNFSGVVLDESSILKGFNSKTKNELLRKFRDTNYKLTCTATPCPNDFLELGNTAEFLNVMSANDMVATFFVHDPGNNPRYRLKGHAKESFWKWVCSWAVMLNNPKTLGYEADGFDLPPLRMHEHIIEMPAPDDFLFPVEAKDMKDRIKERRKTVDVRCQVASEKINEEDGQCVVWCGLNAESDMLKKLIDDPVEIKGSEKDDTKAKKLLDFIEGKNKVLITKPSIAGFGINMQNCCKSYFVGLSDSWEQFYQAIRRNWRFGQKRPVDVHIVIAETEGNVLNNIKRKEQQAVEMIDGMIAEMTDLTKKQLKGNNIMVKKSAVIKEIGNDFEIYMGDCVDQVKKMRENSIDFSIFSPPFSNLFAYTGKREDMGNCKNDSEFQRHFGFLVKELFRVLKPGRSVAFHCMNLPAYKKIHGHVGMKDFRGDLIRLFESEGFIYHTEVCIWKDPVTEMQRTKALGLLYKQLKKDSSMCRVGFPDYLVVMRKPGDNAEPISHTEEEFDLARWQVVASPVWMDIRQTKVLKHKHVRGEKDEKHICPLQLEVIERALEMWSNPRDLVLSPFMGIGSEGYVCLRENRRFIGVELKEEYFRYALENLKEAEKEYKEQDLFAGLEE